MARAHLVLAALFGLGLAGCDSRAGEKSQPVALSPDPPSLWSIASFRGGGAAKRELICAGAVIRQGLQRAMPEADGVQCALIDQASSPAGVFTGRCRLGAQVFGVHSVTTGDVGHDFTVKSVMEAAAGGGKRYVSTQRYRQVLTSCPAGWNDGDAGSPGDQRVVNALTGVAHPVSPPVAAP